MHGTHERHGTTRHARWRRAAGAAAIGAALVGSGGCRAASEGSPAGDIARVAADVAARTGAPASSADDAGSGEACRRMLARPLTEETAVKVALLRNASVRASYERLGVARADLLQAGLVANPVFAISRKAFSAGPEVELGLVQSFVDLFFVPLRRRVAEHELCAAQAEVVRELVHLVYDVRRTFVAVHGAEEVVRVRREAQAAITTARDLVRSLHAAGNARDPDVTLEEVAVTRAGLAVEAAELTARDARETLHVLLGLRGAETPWTIDGRLAPLPASPAAADPEARALAASLDLLATKAHLASTLARTGLARRQGLFPLLDLGVVGKREAGDGTWGFGPEVTTAIPVFDHGQAKVLAADAGARALAARHEQLTVEVASAARRLSDRARTLRERERTLREVYLPLRLRYVDDTARRYHAMQVGAFDVLEARDGETDARREHVETLVEAWRAHLDLAELLAGNLDGERLDALHLPDAADAPTPPKEN